MRRWGKFYHSGQGFKLQSDEELSKDKPVQANSEPFAGKERNFLYA